MSELGEKIVEEMFSMLVDIVETSQNYIPQEKRLEWIRNLMTVAQTHRVNVEIIMNKKEIKGVDYSSDVV